MPSTPDPTTNPAESDDLALNASTGRRRFLGYLLAAPTLAAAAWVGQRTPEAHASTLMTTAAPATPQVADILDIEDALTAAAKPTTNLVTVQVNEDGTVSYDLPRAEVGQGLTTAIAMLIAEEMDVPIDKVDVTLADARPELVFNQFTGGSNSINSLYTPVRVACAVAKGALLQAAAAELDAATDELTARLGLIEGPTGSTLSYGDLAAKAAKTKVEQVPVNLKPESEFRIVGKPHRRIDGVDIVTGKKKFTTDLQIRGAKPCMVCRPPTINGEVKSVRNLDAVRTMPGVTDVVPISSGIAVRADTFGQCIDAVNALEVSWGRGPKDAESDHTVEAELKAASPPMLLQQLPGTEVVEAEFSFAWAGNSALETNCAIADVREDRAEVWASMKIPIVAQGEIAQKLGLPQSAVTAHVITGGGSFGRRLFHDAALEAAEASQKMGKPVKLMWHRADDCRQGRVHPMAHSKVRAIVGPNGVLGYEQHHTSVRTDFSHGFGEMLTSVTSRAPVGGLALSEDVFELTQSSPYDFGPTKQLLLETHQGVQDNQHQGGFNTGSMRSVYSPSVCTAQELFVDVLAEKFGKDPLQFRRQHAKNEKFRTVLDAVAHAWSAKLPPGFGQGIALHAEHKQVMACLVQIDCRPETVNREVRQAVTGPRVSRAVFATIPGKVVINPLGMEAQIQGGFTDGMALALTSSLHLDNGHFLEASWDNYAYTRQWNVPERKIEVHILPPDPEDKPAGAGEMAVSLSKAAVACAYVNAVGTMPAMWPVAHTQPLHFTPYPTVPPLPPSPTDGLEHAR